VFGAFYQLPPFSDKSVLVTYAIQYDVDPPPNDVASASDRLTIGARAFRSPAPGAWNYETEAIWQQGEAGGTEGSTPRPDLDNRAYFLHLEVGYAFDVAWRPNLMFQYDLATGDKDPADASLERFNTLLGARRFDFGPTGIYGPIARSNVESPGVRLTYVPKPRWQGMAAYRVLKLDQARDQWVGSGWRDPTGQSGKSIGKQLETSFTWAAIKDRLSVETGFALLELGRFAKQVQGPALRGDPRYFYAQVTTSF
jgi:hypothetical protein